MSTENITIALSNSEEFKVFYPFMEMIARENFKDRHGKMLCPMLKFDINGLDEAKTYDISLAIERFDSLRYAYVDNLWGVSEKRQPEKVHEYRKISKGTRTGAAWMEGPLAFAEARITNKKKHGQEKNMFYVTPLHKYVPVLYIKDTANPDSEMRFPIEAAQFLPVTTYYDPFLAEWKCTKNQFTTVRNRTKTGAVKRKSDDNGSTGKKRSPAQNDNVLGSTATSPISDSSVSSSNSMYTPFDYTSPFSNDYSNFQMNHYDPMFNQFDYNAQNQCYNYPMPQNFPPVPPMVDFNSFNPMQFNSSTTWPSVNPMQYPTFQNENFYPPAADFNNFHF